MVHIVYIVIIIIICYYLGLKIDDLEKHLEYKELRFNEIVEYTDLLEKKCDRLERESVK